MVLPHIYGYVHEVQNCMVKKPLRFDNGYRFEVGFCF